MTDTQQSRPNDLARQIIVIAAATFMIIAAMVGTGLLGGTAVQDLQGGALDEDGSYLAPASPAFSIWSAIYLGLIAYTVWQALPGQRTKTRQRAIGWWIALTMVLNGLWLVLAQFTTLIATVIGIVVLLVVLGITFRISVETRDAEDGLLDALLIDGVTGLHLGWVTLATVANITAWLTQLAPDAWGENATGWGVAVLIVVGLIGLAIAWFSRGRIAPALALAWGLAWLGVARLTGEPVSIGIGVTAIVVGAVVLGATALIKAGRVLWAGND